MLSSSGIIDMLDTDPNSTLPPAVQQYQQDDFFQLGLLILALACGTPAIINPEQQAQSLAYVSRQYSEDLIVLLQYVVLSLVFRVQVFLWSNVGVSSVCRHSGHCSHRTAIRSAWGASSLWLGSCQ
jgi:hypothetical protein